MTPKSFLLTQELHDYLMASSTPLDQVQVDLIERTAALGSISRMQVAPEQGALLTTLAATMGARSAVEVGTFTGYSALCIARGLAQGGRLICCDVDEEWTALALAAWTEAGIEDRIDLRIAPAIDTLRALPDEATIDLAFVDADKASYSAYYEELVARLRPGGLVIFDNVLWSGAVLDPADTSEDTVALRELNAQVAADPRVSAVMLPVADGLTVARRLP